MLFLAIRGGVSIGRNVHVGPFSIVSSASKLEIGDDCYFGKFCTIQVAGRIGNGVLIANSVGIVGRLDHEYRIAGIHVRDGRWVGDDASLADNPANAIDIGDDVWVGYGATILSGVVIGTGAIISAGSVVARDVPEFSIVAGNPARVVAQRFATEEERQAHLVSLQTRYGKTR